MPPGKFECFMVYGEVGADEKLQRLTVEERWAFVAGVLAIAHKATPRGHLMIADGIRAEAADVAAKARVSEDVAQSCLDKLAELRIVRPLKAPQGVEPQDRTWVVVNFGKWNPDPSPSNTREAWRDRKRKQRERDRGPAYVGAGPDMRAVRARQEEERRREEQLALGERGTGLRRAS